jgi:hypothetical protein
MENSVDSKNAPKSVKKVWEAPTIEALSVESTLGGPFQAGTENIIYQLGQVRGRGSIF